MTSSVNALEANSIGKEDFQLAPCLKACYSPPGKNETWAQAGERNQKSLVCSHTCNKKFLEFTNVLKLIDPRTAQYRLRAKNFVSLLRSSNSSSNATVRSLESAAGEAATVPTTTTTTTTTTPAPTTTTTVPTTAPPAKPKKGKEKKLKRTGKDHLSEVEAREKTRKEIKQFFDKLRDFVEKNFNDKLNLPKSEADLLD